MRGADNESMHTFKQDFTTRQYMITPNFEYFHYADKSTMEIEYHNHDFFEVYFFISGNVTYIVEGKAYRLKPWDILIIHNQELHKPIVEPGETYERIVLWVNPDFLAQHSDGKSNLALCFETKAQENHTLIRPSAETVAYIKNILARFEKACNSFSFGSSILKNIYLLELLVYLNKAFLETFNEESDMDIEFDEKVDSIMKYINSNLSSPLTLDELSSRFYISKYHLLREFKKYTGYTIHQYIQQKRLIMAKSLLKEGVRVTEVCEHCGFGDYSNFIRAFKKAYGISPGKYYKSVLK